MDKLKIMEVITKLAMSNGFYGRLLANIRELPDEEREAMLDKLEQQNFKDEVDLVLYLEG